MNRFFGGVAGRLLSGVQLGVVAAAFGVVAVAAEAQNFTFNSVQIEGNRRVQDGTILSYAGISRGETITAGQLNDAAQAIRSTGLFESVDLEPRGSTLVIDVVEYPTINRINFEGNRRLSDGELSQVVNSIERRVFNPNQAEADVAAITEAYAGEGRINATVRPVIIERSDNRVDLVFEIFEGGQTEVERISFVGNRNFSEWRLRNILETKQAGILRAIINSDTLVEDRIEFDRTALTDFYRSRGYVDMQVQNVDVALTRDRSAYLVTFNIQEGQQYRFGSATVVSEIPEADAAEFMSALRLRPGAVYSPEILENNIARLERLAIRRGIDFLRADPVITRNDRNQTLDVQFVLRRGERIFVERIDIEGNNTTLDRVIRSQFRTVEGDPFNPRTIRESANRIRALGYFSDVRVNTRDGSSGDQVIVDVDVDEAPTGSLSFGANYNSDDGVSFLASFTERNFLGRGQELDFQLSTGSQNRVLSFDFAEPQFLGRDVRFGLNLSYRQTDYTDSLYDTSTFRFAPSLQFPVSENGRLSVYYAAEYSDITDVQGMRTDAPEERASLLIFDEADEGGLWTQSLGYTYSFDTRRTGLNPNAGVLLRFGQEFGVGDSRFVRTTALARAETRVFREDVTISATIEAGHLAYSEGDSRVTDRFFLSTRALRGFEARGVGPRDAATLDALGGNSYAVARLEAEFPLGLPEEYGITGGLFVDYGSVWDVGNLRSLDESDVLYNEFTPRAVAGAAIFWDTPIGPLRFNFTEALIAEEFDRPRSFDLTIQTEF